MRVLLIKMSSLGDVVHALPAVTDAAARGIVFDWVVEEAFAPIAAAHPAVRQVIPIAWRRWRKDLVGGRGQLAEFLRTLRACQYDLILDAQGLIKSAAVSLMARGVRGGCRAGLNFTSAREPWSALAASKRLTVPVGDHAVHRLRTLFADALGYPRPETPADFGLPRTGSGGNRCLLLHGTTWASKHWPEPMWCALAAALSDDGWQVALPWGSEAERERAERITRGATAAEVLPALDLTGMGEAIAATDLVVGVDSGLTHLAGAMGVPTVVIYGSTSALRTGVLGPRVINLQSELQCAPCLARECRYRGAPQLWRGEAVEPPCYALVNPERVRAEAMRLLGRAG